MLAQEVPEMKRPLGYPGFNGTIELNVRDSESDWARFAPKASAEGAPNILFVLYDDTELSAWSTYCPSKDLAVQAIQMLRDQNATNLYMAAALRIRWAGNEPYPRNDPVEWESYPETLQWIVSLPIKRYSQGRTAGTSPRATPR